MKPPDYLNPEAQFIKGDIRNESDVKKSLKILMSFSISQQWWGVGQSMYQIERYTGVNTYGTAIMLDAVVNGKYNLEKIIVASSMSIYGEGTYACRDCDIVYPRLRNVEQMEKGDWEMNCPSCGKKVKPLPTGEEKPLYPTSVYAINKRDHEELCLSVGRAYNIPAVALRFFNTYGTRQSLSNPYTGVAAIFLSRIKTANRLSSSRMAGRYEISYQFMTLSVLACWPWRKVRLIMKYSTLAADNLFLSMTSHRY